MIARKIHKALETAGIVGKNTQDDEWCDMGKCEVCTLVRRALDATAGERLTDIARRVVERVRAVYVRMERALDAAQEER